MYHNSSHSNYFPQKSGPSNVKLLVINKSRTIHYFKLFEGPLFLLLWSDAILSIVDIVCVYTLCAHNVHIVCVYTLCVHNVHIVCVYTLCVHNVHIVCVYTLCVCTQCSHCMCVHKVHIVCVYTLCVHNVHIVCVYTLCVHKVHNVCVTYKLFTCAIAISSSEIYCIYN